MDLYVERQCIDAMRDGDSRQFLLLYNAYFVDIYKYVARRVDDPSEAERIVRLTFLDALGQIQETPTDVGYIVRLYSLAKPRVWDVIAKASFPEKQGLIAMSEERVENKESLQRAEKMMKKLSLEEREIIRLKFFEEVSDGDVMTILELKESEVGTKIYRVLKRAHFLLFGESDEKQGVYFGQLSGLFEGLKNSESIEIPEVFKLSLKSDITGRIERKETAFEAEVAPWSKDDPLPKAPAVERFDAGKDDFEEKEPVVAPPVFEMPFEAKKSPVKTVGSNDPAKIFVEAVKEMREEEAEMEREKFENREDLYDFIDRFKHVLIAVPIMIFVIVVGFVAFRLLDFTQLVERGYPNECNVEVAFDGDFSDGEMRNVNKGVSDRLCGHFDVKKLTIKRTEEGIVNVEVDVPDWFLEYKFAKKVSDWRIKKYARTLVSDEESGEVSGDNGSA